MSRPDQGFESGTTRPLSDVDDEHAWAMVESSPDGMVLADEAGAILLVNAQVEKLFGYDRVELLGRPVEQLVPERFRLAHRTHRTHYRADPQSRAMNSGIDLRGVRKDGTEFPVEVSLSPTVGRGPLRVIATVRDVSERRANEARVRLIQQTIDAAHDGVFMFAPGDLRFTYVNQGACNQLGYSRDELLAMTPLHIKPGLTDAEFRHLLAPILDGERSSRTFTTTHRHCLGADTPIEVLIEYPETVDGHERVLVAVVRDLTERTRAEAERERARAQLSLLEERERIAHDLHDMVIQRLFATGMRLQGMQSLITDPVANGRLVEAVIELDRTIAEIRSTIFSLGQPEPTTVIARLQAELAVGSTSLGLEPDLVVEGDVEVIDEALAGELVAVLSEALSNAARHAEASRVAIRLMVGTDQVSLQVSDDGIGIDQNVSMGNGLDNLAGRAARLGGWFRFVTNADGGTTLDWVVRGPKGPNTESTDES